MALSLTEKITEKSGITLFQIEPADIYPIFNPNLEIIPKTSSSSETDDEEVIDIRDKYDENMSKYQCLSQEEKLLLEGLCEEGMQETLLGLRKIAERKLSELNSVIHAVHVNECTGVTQDVLHFILDSEPTSILNKYLNEIKVGVSQDCVSVFEKLFVTATLFLTPSNQILKTTSNNLQPILQGRASVPVAGGFANFDRLKIMEVSSKYQFQSFCLVFQLENHSNSQSVAIGHPIMSSPFQVLSRNKRKIEHTPSSKEPKKKRCRDDSKYVDITALLVLPQKEAAAKLGISESMLCKRFKESTRRKWPYRYLRKIEKTIKKLEETEETLSQEEKVKLGKHREERTSCLQPIKIRVTGRDSVEQFPLSNVYSVSTFDVPLVPPTKKTIYQPCESDDELDSIALVLHTLKGSPQ